MILVAMLAEASAPKPIDRGAWVSIDDYPAQAMRNAWGGKVAFTLDVDAAGRVTGCKVTQGSGHDVLDGATCALVSARGRFEPAHDASGNAVTGQFASAINWEIPDTDPAPLVPMRGTIEVDIDPDGHGSNCHSTLPSDLWPNLADLCQTFVSDAGGYRLQFAPAVDHAGKAVARHVVITIDMAVKTARTPD